MTRRIGFGGPNEHGDTDARISNAPPEAPAPASEPTARGEAVDAAGAERRPSPVGRVVGGAFLVAWLIAWGFGIFFAIGALTGAPAG